MGEPPRRSPEDLQAALEGSACLGCWTHDVHRGTITMSPAFAALLGFADAETGIALDDLLGGIHAEDRLRIESVLHAACEAGGPFEAEFRLLPSGGVRWIRLMGRAIIEHPSGVIRTRGLAFDLTEGRSLRGTPAQQAQRQVNRLADHAVAMKGLVATLSNADLTHLVDRVAVEIGFELARRLHGDDHGRRH